MSVLWIIERTGLSVPGLARTLMGDYAVRVFASLESFTKLVRLGRNQRPNLLLVDWRQMSWDSAKLLAAVRQYLTETPVVIVGSGPASGLLELPHLHIYADLADALSFSTFLDMLLRAGPGRRGIVRYRSILLDYERLQCLPAPGEKPFSLPYKEAQLLRLLLERPGVCLTRAEIQAAIWDKVKVTPRTIDSHISRLRRRLDTADVEIQGIYGGGYVLK